MGSYHDNQTGCDNNKQAQVLWTNDQLTKIFRSHDTNNDGKLSRDELKAAFKYLGSHCSSYRTLRAFNHADGDNDGFIDLSSPELSQLVSYAHSRGYKIF
ncbi:Parvalbumin [Parasponia andersonii]|uniref:Parvalbumin n=1 Tax=Parasponia andersonii TaxID=3476 RepID=A0A2P5E3V2_PARAD|nr:Parvalbumin [Parasponia andersonii]